MSVERRKEFVTRINALLAEYADMADAELPVVGDWVLVVSVDDAVDPSKGADLFFHAPHQWRHRSIGLLEITKHAVMAGDRWSDDDTLS